jgi:iron complex transport system substrate-binding protein
VKVVSLLPSTTEIVFALGRGDDLVGVTFECDFPPEARTRRVVSTSALPEGLSPGEIDAVVSERMAAGQDLYQLDQGALSDLDADLVLTQDLCAVCAVDIDRVDDALDYLGCSARVLTVDPSTLEGVLDSILDVGAALDAEPEARDLVAALRQRLDDLARLLDGAPRRDVLLLEWIDPPFSAGHWVPDVLAAGGAHPVLAHPGADSQRLSWDTVASTPAEAVIVAPCGYHLEPAYEQACEVATSGRLPGQVEVWAVDADSYFVRPGPRLVDGAELVGQMLHPHLCGVPDPARARRVP